MQTLFKYNWMVREDWYHWCEELSEEELLQSRTGGMGSILQTLLHIVDVEWSWIQVLQGKPDFQESFEDYKSLEKIRKLDAKYHLEVETFVNNWNDKLEDRYYETLSNGNIVTWGEIMRHIIVHEIHHIGQLSIWAREMGKQPVSANLFDRGLSK